MPRHILVFDTETKVTYEGENEHHTMKMAWCVFATLDERGKVIAETLSLIHI